MEKIINIEGDAVFINGNQTPVLTKKTDPTVPQIGDVVEFARETFTATRDAPDYRLVLTPTGKTKTYHKLWNGRGWAEVGQSKDERVIIHE